MGMRLPVEWRGLLYAYYDSGLFSGLHVDGEAVYNGSGLQVEDKEKPAL